MSCNQTNYNESISLAADMYETDFKLRKLKVQLTPFSTIANSSDVSSAKITRILKEFGKNNGLKLLMQEVLTL